MSCLHIVEINPLLVASFANICSHSAGCLSVSFQTGLGVGLDVYKDAAPVRGWGGNVGLPVPTFPVKPKPVLKDKACGITRRWYHCRLGDYSQRHA